MKISILASLLIAISFSCLAFGRKKLERTLNTYINHDKHELVMSLGPPARIASDGADGEIYIYASSFVYFSTTWYDYKMFYINRAGKIYTWRTSREQSPPQQINLFIR